MSVFHLNDMIPLLAEVDILMNSIGYLYKKSSKEYSNSLKFASYKKTQKKLFLGKTYL